MSTPSEYMIVDGRPVPINGERNVLELVRNAGINIPTFCYHSELSVYGACRLCIVDVEGEGIKTSCTMEPRPGMRVKTSTEEIREIRKIAVELLLANHDTNCPSCPRIAECKLKDIAKRLGIKDNRFKVMKRDLPIDKSSPSIVRDPNKCILCGDCVRVCHEIQNIGAIDFVGRGAGVMVLPAFGNQLASGECVNCGQCAAVCPTGALTPHMQVDEVWSAIYDEKKTVVAQIAPAVRVALGEMFGMKIGSVVTGQIVAALKRLGFDKVYDTSFAADMTVLEEAEEFIARKTKGENLPLFTSCCPAWVKFAEQYYPELLPNLSTCKSPQQMFGAVAKDMLPKTLKKNREDIVVVSIMPCTAKKFEALRPEFTHDGIADVDIVITTQELGLMIQEAGLKFDNLSPESLDLPMGFKTGAGVIFGASGGVSEAVLRYASERLTGESVDNYDFEEVRGEEGIRTAHVKFGDVELKLAIVHGLANAKIIAEEVKNGTADYDLIEVMACPGGCIDGAGQPVTDELSAKIRRDRTHGIFETDKTLQVHKSQENPYIVQCYANVLGEVGGEKAHELLHTHYKNRKVLKVGDLALVDN